MKIWERILALMLMLLLLTSSVAAEESMSTRLARRLLESYAGKQVDMHELEDPEGVYSFAGVRNVRFVGLLTGEDSINKTLSNYGVGGTDLGFTATIGDTTYFFFGDTHIAHDQGSTQLHNSVAWTTDDDYTDGIVFDGMLTGEDGKFIDFITPEMSTAKVEAAAIPGGAFALGNSLYVSYMSVLRWTNSHAWPSNYGSFVKSDDGGKTWIRLENLTWPGESNFVQNAPQLIGDMVYVMGTGSGRGNPMSLMRVPVDQFENFDAYEYLTGYGEDGSPIFEKGEAAMMNALELVEQSGEFSVMYSDYLGEWIIMHKVLAENNVICTAKEIWGPYSASVSLFEPDEFWVPYGTVMIPRYASEDGSKIAFLMSMYWPVYNVGIFEVELMKK